MAPFSVPAKQVSAWVTETDPKSAQEWITNLPMGDIAEASREIYQAIYTLNRLKIGPASRFKLLQLYQQPVDTISSALKSQYQKNVFPLNEIKRQLAEFVRELQMEMAHGYKCTILDAEKARFMWGKKELKVQASTHAMFYLGEVLKCSYEVYMACPSMVWQEIHGIYQYAERLGWLESGNGTGADISPITKEYLINILMGLNNPYQLPEQELGKVREFLEGWAQLAEISPKLEINNIAGHFLIDLTSDSPPAPFPSDVSMQPAAHLRSLNALGIARKLQDAITRLKSGVPVSKLGLQTDCLDSDCLEMLKRMMRNWGLAVRRSRSRIKARGKCFIASGLRAIHYFSSGQTPFSVQGPNGIGTQSPAAMPSPEDITNIETDVESDDDSGYIDLDVVAHHDQTSTRDSQAKATAADSVFRIEQWRIADESAGGMRILHNGQIGARVRVGDLLGVQDSNNPRAWRIGAVRWLKTPGKARIEVGLEMITPDASPVAIRLLEEEGMEYSQALLVPPMPALKRPATLIMPAGFYKREKPLEMIEADGLQRKVKALDLLEHTNVYEHIVFADMAADASDTMFSL
ncbi:MAG: hypothetical protein ACC635_00245 [Acidiferrobacterales bacterium]